MKVSRTGGIAGVNDVVQVGADGHWTATRKGGATSAGTATPAQLARLRTLVVDSGWAAQGQGSGSSSCRDGFVYTVTGSAGTAAADDCTAQQHPALLRIVEAVFAVAGV